MNQNANNLVSNNMTCRMICILNAYFLFKLLFTLGVSLMGVRFSHTNCLLLMQSNLISNF